MRSLLLAAFVFIAPPVAAQAPQAGGQVDALQSYRAKIEQFESANGEQRAAAARHALDILANNERDFTNYMISPEARIRYAFVKLSKALEESRIDKQVGAGSGTTSLVSKGSVPAVLGLAVENGALTQTTIGNGITFRGNLAGISKLLLGREMFPYCPPGKETGGTKCAEDAFTRGLEHLSFVVLFDASRDSQNGAAAPVFTGSHRQISSFGIHFDIYNHRDVTSDDYKQKWRARMQSSGAAALRNAGASLGLRLNDAYGTVLKSDDYSKWLGQSVGKLLAAQPAQAEPVFFGQLDELAALARRVDPEIDEKLAAILDAYDRYFAETDQLLQDVANKPIFAFEYTADRPVNQPALSNFRLIFEHQPFHGKAAFTANAAFTVCNSTPAGAPARWKRLRDLQAGVEFDKPFGNVARYGPVVFSLAGSFQHLREPAVLPDAASSALLIAPKGNIGAAQAKLTIPIKGSGVKIPIALTYSSRTELADKADVRGNIGLTFDTDTLFLRPK